MPPPTPDMKIVPGMLSWFPDTPWAPILIRFNPHWTCMGDIADLTTFLSAIPNVNIHLTLAQASHWLTDDYPALHSDFWSCWSAMKAGEGHDAPSQRNPMKDKCYVKKKECKIFFHILYVDFLIRDWPARPSGQVGDNFCYVSFSSDQLLILTWWLAIQMESKGITQWTCPYPIKGRPELPTQSQAWLLI